MRNINGIFKKDTSLVIDCPFFFYCRYIESTVFASVLIEVTELEHVIYVNATSKLRLKKRIKSMFIIIGYFNILC